MSPLQDLPLLSQLTAESSEDDDIIENYYLNSSEDHHSTMIRPLYTLEFFMGINYGELRPEMSPNIVHVRSSIKRLLQDQKLAVVPTGETLDKILKLHALNLDCKVYDRTHYTDVLPHQEYEYIVRSLGLKESLSIISHDGSRQIYTTPHDNLPHFRSMAHPLLVVRNAASTLFAGALQRLPVKDVKVMVIRSKWYKAPATFAQKPDWKELGHPLDRMGDPVEEILAHENEVCPDQISDTSSSTSYTSLVTSIAPQHIVHIQRPGTKRWVEKMRKIVDRKIGYDEEVSNDKQIKLYRKEKNRPYEEVMRTSRVSARFAPYLRPKYRTLDDIFVPL